MEPYIPKWHFYLYRALHGHRKIVRRPLPLLLLEEKDENASGKIIGAAAAGVVDDDPLSISYQCMCLAQMFSEKRQISSKEVKRWTNGDTHASSTAAGGGNDDGEDHTLNQYYPWRFGQYTFTMSDQVLECILEKTV